MGYAAGAELRHCAVLEVPSIFAAEVVSALRALVFRRELSIIRATTAIDQVRETRTIEYPFEPFVRRAWELRDNLTVYDAWYLALAEWLQTTSLPPTIAWSGPPDRAAPCASQGPLRATENPATTQNFSVVTAV